MKTKSKIYSLCLASSLFVACNNDDKEGSNKEKSSEETLSVFDVKTFKNTKSKEEAINKANETNQILDGISTNKNQLTSSLRSQLTHSGVSKLSNNNNYNPDYDFANFQSCDEVITVLEALGALPDEVNCMRVFNEDLGLYQPAELSFKDGDFHYAALHYMTFKRTESGQFVESPLFPEEEDLDIEESHETEQPLEAANETSDSLQASGFEESSQYTFDFGLMFGNFEEDFENCDEAYRNFENTYAGMESNLKDVVSMVKKPGELSLASKTPKGAKTSELLETEVDDQSAVKLSFGNVEDDVGISSEGFVSLGADESKVLARMQLKVSQDSKKLNEAMFKYEEEMFELNLGEMPEFPEEHISVDVDMSFGADFEERILEMTVKSEQKYVGEYTETIKMEGIITVSDKKENKYVEKYISARSEDKQFGSSSLAYKTRATLKNDNSIENIGSISMDDEVIKYNYTIYKDQFGNCKVSKDFGENILDVVKILEGEKTESDEVGPKK